MKIAIAADHEGYALKTQLIPYLTGPGHGVEDLGTNSTAPVGYPDYAEALGNSILQGRAERGIVVCGSGVGAAVAANKLPGIRACVCHDTYSAHESVEHDEMNILAMGSQVVGRQLAFELVHAYLNATFSGAERHVRRIAKIRTLEEKYLGAKSPAKGAGQ
jgi:ribose 5-phosphate isomerase B